MNHDSKKYYEKELLKLKKIIEKHEQKLTLLSKKCEINDEKSKLHDKVNNLNKEKKCEINDEKSKLHDRVNNLNKEKNDILKKIASIAGKDNDSDFKENIEIIVQKLNDCDKKEEKNSFYSFTVCK